MSRPFDISRNGFVLGEGSGAVILEDLEHAKARGATIYAEVVGFGSAADAWDLIQPVEKGDGVRRALLQALERHDVKPEWIDMINPHGTSTPLGDLREAQAFWAVFGDRTPEISISATKSLTGHLMGAAGAVEAIFTILAVHNQAVPGVPDLPGPGPGDQPQRAGRDRAAGDPLRDLRQRGPRRPQRGRRVQALRRRLREPSARWSAVQSRGSTARAPTRLESKEPRPCHPARIPPAAPS